MFLIFHSIDFQNPVTDKPANLANSAVLRMLEEEERNRRGLPSKSNFLQINLSRTHHNFSES